MRLLLILTLVLTVFGTTTHKSSFKAINIKKNGSFSKRVVAQSSRIAAVPIVITPVYGPGFTGNSATAIYNRGVVASAISFYQTNVFTPTLLNVSIVIQNIGTGLGQSTASFLGGPYSVFSSALVAQSPLALAAGVAGPTNLASGSPNINVKTVNLRALGLLPAPVSETFCSMTGALDGCIEINLSVTDVGGGGDGSNTLFSTLQHEINEILGMGSQLPDPGDGFPSDLYRWASPGVRSFAANPDTNDPCIGTPRAYFSASSTGALGTNLSDFNNCNNGGDYGDWATVVPPVDLINNAFSTGPSSVVMTTTNPESKNLQLIGYSVNPTVTTTRAPTRAPTIAPTGVPTTAAPTTTPPPSTTTTTTTATTTTSAPTSAPPTVQTSSDGGLWIAVGVLSALSGILLLSLMATCLYIQFSGNASSSSSSSNIYSRVNSRFTPSKKSHYV